MVSGAPAGLRDHRCCFAESSLVSPSGRVARGADRDHLLS